MTDSLETIAERYRRFAAVEAAGSSECYRRLAEEVANSAVLLAFIAGLPADRQQPNLFLAAVRQTAGLPDDPADLADLVRRHGTGIRAVMLTRTTQTNEPARCAVLLPILARLPQPLALLEVGASAGLCLLPDRYAYDYGGGAVLRPAAGGAPPPVFPCRVEGGVPVPRALPTVVWRRGLDLNPLAVDSAGDVRWLETLVWPEHADRARRLAAALRVARENPPVVERGDMLDDLAAVAATAPAGATLVVFHTAVLSYEPSRQRRARIAALARDIGDVWICNEAPGVFPEIAERAPPPPRKGQFLVAVDGVPTAWAAPHGGAVSWIAGPPR